MTSCGDVCVCVCNTFSIFLGPHFPKPTGSYHPLLPIEKKLHIQGVPLRLGPMPTFGVYVYDFVKVLARATLVETVSCVVLLSCTHQLQIEFDWNIWVGILFVEECLCELRFQFLFHIEGRWHVLWIYLAYLSTHPTEFVSMQNCWLLLSSKLRFNHRNFDSKRIRKHFHSCQPPLSLGCNQKLQQSLLFAVFFLERDGWWMFFVVYGTSEHGK